MEQGQVAVIAGFQGIGPDKRITTLGRGGSDTSAVAVAAALEAACDIYTDVDGVYTADPRIVTGARKLDRISYEEMLEQASLGAKVLQTRSVELAMVYKVPLQVRSSFEAPDSPNQNKPDGTGPGTLVCDEDKIVEQHVVSGIAYSRDEAKVSIRKVKDQPGVSAAHVRPAGGSRHQRRHDRAERLGRRLDRRHHLHRGAQGPAQGDGSAERREGQDRLLTTHAFRRRGQGFGRGHRHAQPCRRCRQDVPRAGRQGHQHPGDHHLRDQGQSC